LIVEKPEKIQLAQGVAGLLDTVNNTSLEKHRNIAKLSHFNNLTMESTYLKRRGSSLLFERRIELTPVITYDGNNVPGQHVEIC